MIRTENVVVVGAGLAASSFAFHLRQRGHDGPVTLLGEEAAAPYDRPPLSKEQLWSAVLPEPRLLRDASDYAAVDIGVRTGSRVVALNTVRRNVELGSGDRVGFDRLVIATGCRPRQLHGIDASLSGVHVLRSFGDLLPLRSDLAQASRLVIVGGGLVGAEVASGAIRRGLDVTVVDPMPVLLARSLGGVTSERVTRMHRDAGVRLELGVGVAGISGASGSVEQVVLSDGRALPADVVLLALGAEPDVRWLAGSGVEVRRGVLTDQHHRTSVPGIYAIGDVAETHDPRTGLHAVVEHWMNARDQAVALADAFIGDAGEDRVRLPYFWSEQHGTRIQMLGHLDPSSDHLLLEWISPKPGALYLFGSPDRLTAAVGFNAAARLMRLRPFIAAGASWAEAEEVAMTPRSRAGAV